jgi:glycosyltransferase involved in cell wall biosynthesis
MNPYSGKPSGTSTYIAHLIENLEDDGNAIKLISIPLREPNEKYDTLDTVPIKVRKETSINFLVKLLIKTPGLNISNESIIHTHRPDFMFPFTIFFRKNPKICTFHGIPEIGIKTRKNRGIWRIYKWLERFSIKKIDKFIAVDERTAEYYSEKLPMIKDRISVIPVGLDLDLFNPKDRHKMREKYGFDQGERIILFVGRFSIEKGLDILLRSFKEVHTEKPEARLVLIGDGPQAAELKDMARTHNIKNVTFMSPLAHELIPEMMSCADVFALASAFEGMPTVVLEALACGVPVVASDVGDVGKVVMDGETGYLVKNRHTENFKKGILKVLEDSEIDFQHNCQNVARRYSWTSVYDDIKGIYMQLNGNS